MKQISMSQDNNQAVNNFGNKNNQNMEVNSKKNLKDNLKSSNKNQMVTTRAPKLSNIKNGKQAKGKKEGGCNCNIL